jgi:hypothetical protein
MSFIILNSWLAQQQERFEFQREERDNIWKVEW